MLWNELFLKGTGRSAVAITLASYLVGCFATGYYLVKWKTGRDIRTLGSGNVGARNVGRTLGRAGFLLTSAGDIGKGTAAVGLAFLLTNDQRCALLALIAVVIGHMWPVQLGFRGGKGIATSFGGLILFSGALMSFVGLCLLGYAITRRTVTAGLLAFTLLPSACYILKLGGFQVFGFTLLSGLILFAHRNNIAEEFTHFPGRRSHPAKPDTSVKKI